MTRARETDRRRIGNHEKSKPRVLLKLLPPNAQKRLAFPSNESVSVYVRSGLNFADDPYTKAR